MQYSQSNGAPCTQVGGNTYANFWTAFARAFWDYVEVTTLSKIQENAMLTASLHEAGVAMMRQNLKRRNPDADDEEINALLTRWLHRADDPIQGDVSGDVRVRKLAQ